MGWKCHVCNKVIEPFAEYWLREPNEFDDKGVMIGQGRAMSFCCLGCLFGWAGGKLRKAKNKGLKTYRGQPCPFRKGVICVEDTCSTCQIYEDNRKKRDREGGAPKRG